MKLFSNIKEISLPTVVLSCLMCFAQDAETFTQAAGELTSLISVCLKEKYSNSCNYYSCFIGYENGSGRAGHWKVTEDVR